MNKSRDSRYDHKKTTIYFKKEDIKKDFEKLCSSCNLSRSSVIELLVKDFLALEDNRDKIKQLWLIDQLQKMDDIKDGSIKTVSAK